MGVLGQTWSSLAASLIQSPFRDPLSLFPGEQVTWNTVATTQTQVRRPLSWQQCYPNVLCGLRKSLVLSGPQFPFPQMRLLGDILDSFQLRTCGSQGGAVLSFRGNCSHLHSLTVFGHCSWSATCMDSFDGEGHTIEHCFCFTIEETKTQKS